MPRPNKSYIIKLKQRRARRQEDEIVPPLVEDTLPPVVDDQIEDTVEETVPPVVIDTVDETTEVVTDTVEDVGFAQVLGAVFVALVSFFLL